jgi:hypothetical protein
MKRCFSRDTAIRHLAHFLTSHAFASSGFAERHPDTREVRQEVKFGCADPSHWNIPGPTSARSAVCAACSPASAKRRSGWKSGMPCMTAT